MQKAINREKQYTYIENRRNKPKYHKEKKRWDGEIRVKHGNKSIK